MPKNKNDLEAYFGQIINSNCLVIHLRATSLSYGRPTPNITVACDR